MSSLLVTGSIGIDTVTTPFGKRENCIGGSSVYFSIAASFFTPVRFLGVIGADCPFDLAEVFKDRAIDLTGLETRSTSRTFRWSGSYEGAMNEANTDMVELNVLAEAPPVFPPAYRDSHYVFLANTAPELQLQTLEKFDVPGLVVADTMNLWIETARADLLELLQRLDGLVLNETEARMLSGKTNLVSAAKDILDMGPSFVVIKKGEHGTLLLGADDFCFALPAYPTDAVVDPTGAGDSFAGGMMGYLAGANAAASDRTALKRAVAYGTVTASLVIEDFSIDRWSAANREDIEQRLNRLKAVTQL